MIDNIKVKPLNENPNKVLELLNENKHNIASLVMQYDSIIELYVQLLGGKNWGKPNINEVILPEIIKLLEIYNYDCEFTTSGIYQDGQLVFTLSEILDGNGTQQKIHIKNKQNQIMLTGGILINGERGIALKKDIYDFSKLDECDMSTLSVSGRIQIESPNITKSIKLQRIRMVSMIAEGVELNRAVNEIYKPTQDCKDSHIIYSTFSYNLNEPTISVKRVNVTGDFNYNLSFCIYGGDPTSDNYEEEEVFYNYGDCKLKPTFPVEKIREIYKIPMGDPKQFTCSSDYAEAKDREKNYYYKNYDYERLLRNIQSYQNRYPNVLHPMLTGTYINNWTSEFGRTACYYLKKHLFPDKSRNRQ